MFVPNFKILVAVAAEKSLTKNFIEEKEKWTNKVNDKHGHADSLLHNKSYRIYPKYSDNSTPYHICSKILTSTIHYPMLCLKIAG